MGDLREHLGSGVIDIGALALALDALGDEERVLAVRQIGGRDQARLWAACGGRGTTLEDIIPAGGPPVAEVIHAGKNSLPLFSHFEKRFCRPDDRGDVLYGYNEGATRPLIGPGYFVARLFEDRGEVGVDYYQVPPDGASLPPGWPAIQANEKGLQRFVFARMVDYLRKVSDHVLIGRAVKNGKDTSNYFLLCRTGC